MLQAIYNGKVINSFDIKNEYGNKVIDIYEEYKIAGSKGLITCEECGAEVYLRAGDIYTPHFAHKDSNRVCYHKMNKECEEQKKGKIVIYKWLKNQHNNVYIDKKYGSRRANVSLETEKGIIAVQYIRNERALIEWNSKREDYKSLGIKDLYIFGYKEFNCVQESQELFSQIVQKYSFDNTIKILNIENNELILMRYIYIIEKKNGKLYYGTTCSKSYNFKNIKMTLDGNIESDFNKFYTEEFEKHRFIAREKYRAEENEKRRKTAEEKYKKKIKDDEDIRRKSLNQQVEKSFHKTNTNSPVAKNIICISDDFLKEHINKYSNPEGVTDAELDIEIKEFISINSFSNSEWWFGQHKQDRLIKCTYCKKYFTSNYCSEYQYHSGICDNCEKMRNKRNN